jgi:transposase-like protein
MPAKKEYTPEFTEQAVRFVLESIEPNESRRHACERVAPKLSMNPITLCSWVKASIATGSGSSRSAVRCRSPPAQCDRG